MQSYYNERLRSQDDEPNVEYDFEYRPYKIPLKAIFDSHSTLMTQQPSDRDPSASSTIPAFQSLLVRPVPRSHVLLILYDGILLWAVLLAGWNVTHLMTFFVVETLVMAVIAIPRIVLAQRVDLDPFYEGSSSNADLKGAKLFFLFVFVAWFNFGASICILTLSGEILGPGIHVRNGFSPWTLWQELFFGETLLTSVLYWSLVLLIIAAHTVIFQQEFLKESKYRSAIPHNQLPGPILRSGCGMACAFVGFFIMVAARIQWPAIIVFLLGKYMLDAIELQDAQNPAAETAAETPAKTRKERIPPD